MDEANSLERLLDRYVYSRGRFQVWLMGSFASLGLLLSVIGVYGLLAQFVSLQQQEFGVRMAVGATFGDIMRLVLGRGVRLMVVGLVIGIAVTLLLLKRFGIQLGVSDPLDPVHLPGPVSHCSLRVSRLVSCRRSEPDVRILHRLCGSEYENEKSKLYSGSGRNGKATGCRHSARPTQKRDRQKSHLESMTAWET